MSNDAASNIAGWILTSFFAAVAGMVIASIALDRIEKLEERIKALETTQPVQRP